MFKWLRNLFAKRESVEEGTTEEDQRFIFFNCRHGINCAYFLEDLEGCNANAMLTPKQGYMLFTDQNIEPKTGSKADLQRLAEQTGRVLQGVSEYAFYVLGTFDGNLKKDMKDYGQFVMSFDQAVQRNSR